MRLFLCNKTRCNCISLNTQQTWYIHPKLFHCWPTVCIVRPWSNIETTWGHVSWLLGINWAIHNVLPSSLFWIFGANPPSSPTLHAENKRRISAFRRPCTLAHVECAVIWGIKFCHSRGSNLLYLHKNNAVYMNTSVCEIVYSNSNEKVISKNK